ncbi:NADH dehydrogenase [ubiquinone] 1 beta subcomplex subunit 7-like [Pectinophora gossypiella]|uniref:NADH dehydrogenase [ubiquinone] 1 beta subcomplex subunit 7-like n=1 Tax=Pectinophora gossypiella TaxID=13191 RepID=UPI00214F4BAC|nr:NADH dehydrogenase [ubiquinone] 1 beta subcomplex subunit 7-like [Pectinophora gossypiella]
MGIELGTLRTKGIGLEADEKPSFDTFVGFTYKRKERPIQPCEAHLQSARIPPKYRDYCAHLLLEYQVCRYKYFPFVFLCHHERHHYLNCEMEDYVLRMKEFERERRLREREIRVRKKLEQCETMQKQDPPECK